ncbi:MAG: NfeD family protein [Roseburia sp.]|nr:NfeD family protein [Ruminococcus sp.]MCM1154719.1 NfeD family protein [Roseburia sp.]MCM1242997.1 NfeD family protein [Roseburia sp.]
MIADMNMTVVWLVILVILVVIELLTMGLTTIWFAGGALAAALISIPGTPLSLQILVFLVVSALLLYFTRPVAVKYFNRDRVRTNVESMIGRQAIVIGEINNIEGIGQVNTGGMEWTARSSYHDVVIPVGAVVTILGVDGVKLIVEERKEG